MKMRNQRHEEGQEDEEEEEEEEEESGKRPYASQNQQSNSKTVKWGLRRGEMVGMHRGNIKGNNTPQQNEKP